MCQTYKVSLIVFVLLMLYYKNWVKLFIIINVWTIFFNKFKFTDTTHRGIMLTKKRNCCSCYPSEAVWVLQFYQLGDF